MFNEEYNQRTRDEVIFWQKVPKSSWLVYEKSPYSVQTEGTLSHRVPREVRSEQRQDFACN